MEVINLPPEVKISGFYAAILLPDVDVQAMAFRSWGAKSAINPDPTKLMTLCAIQGETFQTLSTFRPQVRIYTVSELYGTHVSGTPSDARW